ncbi:MAG: 3-hydroxyacyl-CoA dehydrogenase family protein [Negativicutes bacterium]
MICRGGITIKTNIIKKIACVGAGIIGSSWAISFILKGYPVYLYDTGQNNLDNAKKSVINNLKILQKNAIITRQAAAAAEKLITYTVHMEEAVQNVQFIQESGPENYEIKQNILGQVEKITSPDTIIASSTSGLLITEITKFSIHPERCIGAHPYNPPHIIPLIEITKGEKTSPEAVKCACDFYVRLGKEPIVLQKESLGFIANRLQMGLFREAVDLVTRGVCSVEDIDKAVTFGPGLRWALLGPNLIFQLAGGQHGIRGSSLHMNPSAEKWLADMAKWDKFPDGWPDIAQAGVDKEMANRSAEFGKTNEEIIQFRDQGLFELLKYHKKI